MAFEGKVKHETGCPPFHKEKILCQQSFVVHRAKGSFQRKKTHYLIKLLALLDELLEVFPLFLHVLLDRNELLAMSPLSYGPKSP